MRYTGTVSELVEGASPRPSRLGRYELITQIGQGGMAEVQLALQRGPAGFEKLVVVKLVHQNLASQKSFVDMLLDEARLAALVKHPNVVDIYDLGHVDGRYFIAMEYLEGEPLLAVLRAGREGKRLDPLSTGRLIADTAEGLDAAHELRTMAGEPIELVHHDISLGNIVVLYNGQVKLVDFGVAKATQSAGPTAKVQGKFAYMAPEKLRGNAGDRRSDLWSLGCVMWEALTLKRLFKGGNDNDTMKQVLETTIAPPSTVNKDVPVAFDAIVMKALARDVDERYATAKQLATDIEEVLRQHAYGGKNDVIARYMQATFEAHLSARKKLLQEVSSKGNASEEILEAAFTASASPHGVVPPGDFSMRVPLPPAALLGPDGAPAEGLALLPSGPVTRPGLRHNKPLLAALAGGLVVLGILLVVVLGGDRSGGAPAPVAGATPGSSADEAPLEGDADQLFKDGMKAYVKGDHLEAVTRFRTAVRVDATYAPAWRALGLAHEKLGEWGQAKTALQRYLQLAPDAPDAAQMRERLGTL